MTITKRTAWHLACTVAAFAVLPAPVFAQDKAADDAANGKDIIVTGQFLNTGASSATKMDIRVLDTPASVSSYNNNFLKAIETSNVSYL